MEFSDLIKQARQKRYDSAKDFFRQAKLPCSYFYYSKIENGTIPDVNLAITILKALGINLRKGLYAWARGQMPDQETRAFFTELDDKPRLSTEQRSVDRSLVINRMQAQLMEANPIYWEILVFFSSHFAHSQIKEKDISSKFHMPLSKLRQVMKELYDYGLLDRDNDGNYRSKEWVYIPYEKDFDRLRDVNFKRALEQFQKQDPKKRFRTTITRLLTKAQQKEVEAKVAALTHAIVDMPDETPPPEAEPYTVGLFAAPRIFGSD